MELIRPKEQQVAGLDGSEDLGAVIRQPAADRGIVGGEEAQIETIILAAGTELGAESIGGAASMVGGVTADGAVKGLFMAIGFDEKALRASGGTEVRGRRRER
jgi:hypothetical protein